MDISTCRKRIEDQSCVVRTLLDLGWRPSYGDAGLAMKSKIASGDDELGKDITKKALGRQEAVVDIQNCVYRSRLW